MRRVWLPIVILAALAGTAAAIQPTEAPPPAPETPSRRQCFAELARYTWDREGQTPVDAGKTFVEALGKCDDLLGVAVERYADFKVHEREAKIFASQKKFVLGAYAVLWGVLILFAVFLFLRQQKLQATIADLEARLHAAEKKP